MSRRRKKRTSFLSAIILEVTSIFALIAIVQPNWTFALVQALDKRSVPTATDGQLPPDRLEAESESAIAVGVGGAREDVDNASPTFTADRADFGPADFGPADFEPADFGAATWGTSGSAGGNANSLGPERFAQEPVVLPPPQPSAWVPPVRSAPYYSAPHYSARRMPLLPSTATRSGVRPPHEWTPHVEYR